jgi:hypothetical protein
MAVMQVRAVESEYHKNVDGLEIYLGVVPARMIRDWPSKETGAMHGGIPAGDQYHHIMIALFNKDGKRITDADITARVGEIGVAQETKKLEPMTISGTITYGNYFYMAEDGTYVIHLEIRLPGHAQPITTQLRYVHVHKGM